MAGILVYNPSDEVIRAKYDGAMYVFRPDERKEIFNTHAGRHLVSRWKKYGLVDITYDDRVAKKYPLHELYVHEKAIEGVENLLLNLYKVSQDFQTVDDEYGDRKPPERFKQKKNHEEVLKRITRVEQKLEMLKAANLEDIKNSEADELMRQAESLVAKAKALNKKKGVVDGKDTIDTKKSTEDRGKGS